MGTNGVDGDLSLNEWVVLALLAEGSAHGFALARGWPRAATWAES